MKVLLIYSNKFSYNPTIKTLEYVDDVASGESFENVQVAFIHVEQEDMEKPPVKAFINFIKWVSRKNEFKKIILHSFGHLSESKATPEFSQNLLNEFEEKLILQGFEVSQTPFGYFLDLNIEAPGFSLARIFKSF